MRAVLFPGQGAQFKGMGRDLFGRFSALVRTADRILGYSIEELCLRDPGQRLAQTQYTQPALYVVNAFAFLAAQGAGGAEPEFLAGHSLGEYNALLSSGVFDFESGLRLVQKRGELMSRAPRGAMAAVLGLDCALLSDLCKKAGFSGIHPANINSPSQVVISGAESEISRVQKLIEAQAGARYVRLNVGGAFHSPLMQSAADEFQEFVGRFTFQDPKTPVISNVTARPYATGDVGMQLVRQITSPVQWNDCVRYMIARGVRDFQEVGPGQILTKLVTQIRQEAAPIVLEDVSRVELSLSSSDAAKSTKTADDVARHVGVLPPTQSETLTDNRSPQASAAKPQTAAELRPSPVVLHDVVPPRRPADRIFGIDPTDLGARSFRDEYGIKFAYIAGSMYKGISSKELVVRMGRAGFMGFLGTGGMPLEEIESDIQYIKAELREAYSYGCNLLHSPESPALEDAVVDILLRHRVRFVEASAYMQITPALVRYKLSGLSKAADGTIVRRHRIIAKVSNTEVARAFLQPPSQRIVQSLLANGQITAEQADIAGQVPTADDICVEADSGGHTDQGVAFALFPAIAQVRDEVVAHRRYHYPVHLGAAGGIGTAHAALAAFMLGADFIVTGSINQCTVEAGTSDAVKDMLQEVDVNDTDYAPAGDMFEIGAKVQVVKKGVFFPARANKLYELYRRHNSIDEIDPATRRQIEEKYFALSLDQVWEETKLYLSRKSPTELDRAKQSAKHKMALIFKWYFARSTRLAMTGVVRNKVDFQIQCGPALGAFNQRVKGTALENWRNRHVDQIAFVILEETGELMDSALRRYAEVRDKRQIAVPAVA
ncbi:hypothetical protein TSA1_18045 [Bradyrhizobium nitroreducens]|uniref:[acyl-carrier-protein] S-malonyltransferase n=2 Tax=Bradyrhizobium nitroreducens TaxID=709803 RepID=A0A2M6UNJ9_9BRAD|nr:hypothetical protein TSA1_18045 [Bradyrhizobium nitroreducens]